MARKGMNEPLPAALPPETRTVGQVVAEGLKLYGRRFWPALGLGLPIGIFGAGVTALHGRTEEVVSVLVGAPLVTLSYVGAAVLVADRPIERRRLVTAFVAGLIVFVPFPALVFFYVLPAIAWLALVGLCVPAAVFEGGGIVESLRRGYRLGRADYVHSLGSMATLGITFYLSTRVMALALNAGSGQAAEIARPVAEGVLWPVVVLGSCLLYFDQVARLKSGPRRRRSRDADLHHAHEPDRPGRPDPEGEPRPATGGQP